jgi:addiction module RelE/StbE family toxin
MHELRWTAQAKKRFDELSDELRKAATKKLDRIKEDPLAPPSKGLKGELSDLRSIAFKKDYRIVYRPPTPTSPTVDIASVAHRSSIYRDL